MAAMVLEAAAFLAIAMSLPALKTWPAASVKLPGWAMVIVDGDVSVALVA